MIWPWRIDFPFCVKFGKSRCASHPLPLDLSALVNCEVPHPSHWGLTSINNAHLWQLWIWFRNLQLQLIVEGLMLFADFLKFLTSFYCLDTIKFRLVHTSLLPARNRMQGSCYLVFFGITVTGKFTKFPSQKFLERLWVTASEGTRKFNLSNTTGPKIQSWFFFPKINSSKCNITQKSTQDFVTYSVMAV